MTKPSKFTTEAKSDIQGKLKKHLYRSAPLVAGIYLQTRLGTLLIRSLGIDDKKGRNIFRGVFDNFTLGELLRLDYKARMITKSEMTTLNTFIELRNDVAHDLDMWEPLDKKYKDAVDRWCHVVISLLSKSSRRKSTSYIRIIQIFSRGISRISPCRLKLLRQASNTRYESLLLACSLKFFP